jgi:hypothetical protein
MDDTDAEQHRRDASEEVAEGLAARPIGLVTNGRVVLRVQLIGGDHIDVTYDEPDTVETDQVIEHVISALA